MTAYDTMTSMIAMSTLVFKAALSQLLNAPLLGGCRFRRVNCRLLQLPLIPVAGWFSYSLVMVASSTPAHLISTIGFAAHVTSHGTATYQPS